MAEEIKPTVIQLDDRSQDNVKTTNEVGATSGSKAKIVLEEPTRLDSINPLKEHQSIDLNGTRPSRGRFVLTEQILSPEARDLNGKAAQFVDGIKGKSEELLIKNKALKDAEKALSENKLTGMNDYLTSVRDGAKKSYDESLKTFEEFHSSGIKTIEDAGKARLKEVGKLIKEVEEHHNIERERLSGHIEQLVKSGANKEEIEHAASELKKMAEINHENMQSFTEFEKSQSAVFSRHIEKTNEVLKDLAEKSETNFDHLVKSGKQSALSSLGGKGEGIISKGMQAFKGGSFGTKTAMGGALALAGYGIVRSIVPKKDPETQESKGRGFAIGAAITGLGALALLAKGKGLAAGAGRGI